LLWVCWLFSGFQLLDIAGLRDAFAEVKILNGGESSQSSGLVHGWSAARCIPHGGHQMSLAIAAGLGLGGNESYPDLFQPYGGFPDGVGGQQLHHPAGTAGHRLRRQGGPVRGHEAAGGLTTIPLYCRNRQKSG
jgi:hypothetical protein